MPDETAPDLSILIVSWNVRDLLAACLRSIELATEPERSQPTTEVLVVDNASSDGSDALVAAEFPWVRRLFNRENLGLTRANNQGLALARGRYILFLNPDTLVVGRALAAMVSYLDEHPEVGAAGPLLRYGDGTVQSSCRRFPTLASALLESTPLAWHWPRNPWALRYRMEDKAGPLPADPGASPPALEVDWLVGAALLVRRAVLDRVGGFDEGYFMYSEELDLCRRVRDAGWRIFYLPWAEVVHYEGKSSEQVVTARHIRFQTSKIRYFYKHHGERAGRFLRFALLGMFAVEWSLEAGKWLLGSRRSLRRERLAAYSQLLKTGLR